MKASELAEAFRTRDHYGVTPEMIAERDALAAAVAPLERLYLLLDWVAGDLYDAYLKVPATENDWPALVASDDAEEVVAEVKREYELAQQKYLWAQQRIHRTMEANGYD